MSEPLGEKEDIVPASRTIFTILYLNPSSPPFYLLYLNNRLTQPKNKRAFCPLSSDAAHVKLLKTS